MNTKAKKASKSTERTGQSRPKGKFALSDLITEIQKAFQGVKERVDIKFLWADCGVHRFRVNFWNTVSIQYSEFVRVIEEDGKLTIVREKKSGK